MANAGLLKKVLKSVMELIQDANLLVSESGLGLQAMDTSHVSLVSMLLRAEGFEHFHCDRNMLLGVNLAAVCKVVKCANTNDAVTMMAGNDETTLSFVFENPKTDRKAEFSLKLMHIDSYDLHITDVDYDATVTMSSADLQRVGRDLAVLGDTIVIDVTPEAVNFSVNGDEGSGGMTFRQRTGGAAAAGAAAAGSMTIVTEAGARLSFSLRLINLFTKATPLSKTVSLHLLKDHPLSVEYRIADAGWLRFYLAPRMED